MNLNIPNSTSATVVEFRATLKYHMEQASAGNPVIVTHNGEPSCVLISPDQAQSLFGTAPSIMGDVAPILAPQEETPVFAPHDEEEEPSFTIQPIPEPTVLEVQDSFVEPQSEIVPPAPIAEAVGIITTEDQPAIEPETPSEDDQSPVEEASVEVAEPTPADAPEENPNQDTELSVSSTEEVALPQCPACAGQSDLHETQTHQHPTEADIPEDAQEAIICEVNVVSPSVVCMRDSVKVVSLNGQDFNICEYHLGQLVEKSVPHDIVSETPLVSS